MHIKYHPRDMPSPAFGDHLMVRAVCWRGAVGWYREVSTGRPPRSVIIIFAIVWYLLCWCFCYIMKEFQGNHIAILKMHEWLCLFLLRLTQRLKEGFSGFQTKHIVNKLVESERTKAIEDFLHKLPTIFRQTLYFFRWKYFLLT